MSVDVSFIIPFHKKTSLLDKVIESIRCQKCKSSWEIIVVDDSRTTRKISFKDCTVIKTNGLGPSFARNSGSAISSGRFLAFIDSDVILREDWLEKCLNEIEKFPGIGAVQAPLSIGQLKEKNPGFLDRYRKALKDWNTRNTDLYMNEDSIMLNTAALLCRRNAFFHVGGFEPKLKRNEDLYFTYRLLMQGYALSTTLETGGKVFHDKGIVSYALKYVRQAQADLAVEKAMNREQQLGLRKFSPSERGFRFFRSLCVLFYRLGTFLPVVSIPTLVPVRRNANAMLGLTPDARVIFNGMSLCLLNIKTLNMAVFPLKDFSWKFPLLFEPRFHGQLEAAGILHQVVIA